MRPNIRWTLPVLCLLCAVQTRPATSLACRGPLPPRLIFYALATEQFFKRPELQVRITKDSVNIPLLETAIFHQTNRERAKLKLPLFKHSWAMNLIKRGGIRPEMETLQFFDHLSPTPANHTPDRTAEKCRIGERHRRRKYRGASCKGEIGSGSWHHSQKCRWHRTPDR